MKEYFQLVINAELIGIISNRPKDYNRERFNHYPSIEEIADSIRRFEEESDDKFKWKINYARVEKRYSYS